MIRHKRAHLFTIYGEPGVGKSRLAREFLEGVEGASILVGRSLPYGEGVTYWPLAEMVKVAAGIADDDPVQEAVSKLRACCGDEAVADLLALAVGVLEGIETERSQQEIAWAAREWAAELADAQPLILVFEDVHWAEEPLLELIEHLAERVKDAPLMILCLARPELLDIRPSWGGGRLRAAATELEPLAPEESEELLDALLADRELSTAERKTLLEKTEGNPLFVEETTRMLLEGGTSSKRIPDTLQAMIAARIDRLRRNEKRLLQRAAVIGRIFWEGAVAHLLPELEELEPVLDDLLLRDFITRESRSSITGERAYRFKHVLIRDVAYAGLAKGARAELHQQVADWLHEVAGEELVEIRAYHLDHAATLLEELDGAVAPRARSQRAAGALEKAGRRALAQRGEPGRRGACSSARSSSSRRSSAASSRPGRHWRLADLPAQAVEMERVFADATDAGDVRLQGLALTALAENALLRDADLPRGRELVEQALVLLDDAKPEDRIEALATRAPGSAGGSATSTTTSAGTRRRSRSRARSAARISRRAPPTSSRARRSRGSTSTGRRASGAEALELAEESGNITVIGWALVSQARIDALRGRLDEAAAGLEQAEELFSESGNQWALARVNNHFGWVERRRGDLRRRRPPLPRGDPDPEAARGPRHALREPARPRAGARLAEEGRRGGALRARGARDRRPARHDLPRDDRMALGIVRAAQGRDEEAERSCARRSRSSTASRCC